MTVTLTITPMAVALGAVLLPVLALWGVVLAECIRAGFAPEPPPRPARPIRLSIDDRYRTWTDTRATQAWQHRLVTP